MWNIVCGNRLIDRKRKEQAQRKHLQALHRVRGLVDNSAPPEYSFLYSRPKAQQLRLERQLDIESQNSILINRMMKSTSEIRSKGQDLIKTSLNSLYRSQQDRRIDEGNQKLVRRLQCAKSSYSNVSRSAKDYTRYKTNIAFSRMDPYYDLESQTAPIPRRNTRPASAKR